MHTPHPRSSRAAFLNHHPSYFLQLRQVLHLPQRLAEPRPSSWSLCSAANLPGFCCLDWRHPFCSIRGLLRPCSSSLGDTWGNHQHPWSDTYLGRRP